MSFPRLPQSVRPVTMGRTVGLPVLAMVAAVTRRPGSVSVRLGRWDRTVT